MLVIAAPALESRDAPMIRVGKISGSKTEPIHHQPETSGEREERPGETARLAKADDIVDEICGGVGGAARKGRDLEDLVAAHCPAADLAEHLLDGSVEVAFGEEAVLRGA
jgi:hypothetical protein